MNQQDPDADFESLLSYLRNSRGVDFTGYKRPSLQRLVGRRMHTAGVASYPEYVDHLQVETSELQALLDALLINVTAFFRDPPAWKALRDQLLPAALAKLDPDEPIRVWSAACASGEEAYSLVIMLHELLGDEEYKRRVKVYATDIDEGALQVARAGRFSPTALAPLSDAQRATYFQQDGSLLVFRADLRPSIVFGRHDLLQDAPISRVLLLSCRNVLMYFTPETQTRVLERFAFALHKSGLLLLGKAEMLLSQSQLFTSVNLPHRIFQARPTSGASRLAALAVGGQGRDANLRRVAALAFGAAPAAQVVLDAHGVLTLINERAQRDLALTRHDLGRAFLELEIARRPIDLRAVVARVSDTREPAELSDVEWMRDEVLTRWDVRVAPLQENGEVYGVHVVFDDVTELYALRRRLVQIHDELSTAYEELQSSSEELETTNEELQSAVEELETTNEELQSTNEELETMNEELQSTNEELQTLNSELRDRTQQVDEANGLLESVLEGLDQAVIVIDLSYRVQLWNTPAERLTGLRSFEAEGLRLVDLELELPPTGVQSALRSVVLQGETSGVVEAEIRNRFGQPTRRSMTASPLVNGHGEVRGAVVTLSDQAKSDDEPADAPSDPVDPEVSADQP